MSVVQQVNLFQPSFQKKEEHITPRTIFTVTAVTLGGILLLSVYLSWKVSGLDDELQRLTAVHKQKLAQLEQAGKKYQPKRKSRLLQAEMEKLEGEKTAKHQILNTITDQVFGNSSGFAAHLEGLARRNVKGLWLTGINITNGGKSIGLRGSSLEPKMVPVFLQRLSGEQAFKGTEFNTFRMERRKKDLRAVDFVLTTSTGNDTI